MKWTDYFYLGAHFLESLIKLIIGSTAGVEIEWIGFGGDE